METVALNFHDEDGTAFGAFQLHAGDDAGKVKWAEASAGIKLCAARLGSPINCTSGCMGC